MLLVDRVTQMVLGESIKAYKNITTNEPFFMGHFPENDGHAWCFDCRSNGSSFGYPGFQNNG